jgi:hypothetical protein
LKWTAGRFRRDRPVGYWPTRGAPKTPGAIGRSVEVPTLCYSTADRHWWLWWPCRDCGGVQLPLRERPGPCVSLSQRPMPAAGECGHCPGCETRSRRAASARVEPTVWYDTLLSDWVVHLTSGIGEAILPLELYWFDAPQAVVYRAASDLAYSGEEFERSDDREPGSGATT